MATNLTQIVPYSQEDVLSTVNTYAQTNFSTDYNGQNISLLTDLISYSISLGNINSTLGLNESVLPLTQNRDTLIYHANDLGYSPRGMTSYQYKLTLTNSSSASFTIPKYAQFTAGAYTYYTISEYIVQGNSSITVTVKEGILHLYTQESILNFALSTQTNGVYKNFIDLPYSNVEDDSIEVFVNYVDINGVFQQNIQFTKSPSVLMEQQIVDLTTKQYIQWYNVQTDSPRLYFSVAGNGSNFITTTTVNVNLLVSSGTAGVATGLMAWTDTNTLLPNTIAITNTSLFIVGEDVETNDSIRSNAPVISNTANRAVAARDYVSISNSLSSVYDSFAWGGEIEIPLKKLGNVFLSTVANHIDFSLFTQSSNVIFQNETAPSQYVLNNADTITGSSSIFLLDSEIAYNLNYLNYFKVLGIQLNHVHPTFLDFNYVIDLVRYNGSLPLATYRANIFSAIENFSKYNIIGFNKSYFHSSMINTIDSLFSNTSGVIVTLNNSTNLYVGKNILTTATNSYTTAGGNTTYTQYGVTTTGTNAFLRFILGMNFYDYSSIVNTPTMWTTAETWYQGQLVLSSDGVNNIYYCINTMVNSTLDPSADTVNFILIGTIATLFQKEFFPDIDSTIFLADGSHEITTSFDTISNDYGVTWNNNFKTQVEFMGYIVKNVLTVTSVQNGSLSIGQIISGAGVTSRSTIIGYVTGSGGVGTYILSKNSTVGSIGSPISMITTSTDSFYAYSTNFSLQILMDGVQVGTVTYVVDEDSFVYVIDKIPSSSFLNTPFITLDVNYSNQNFKNTGYNFNRLRTVTFLN